MSIVTIHAIYQLNKLKKTLMMFHKHLKIEQGSMAIYQNNSSTSQINACIDLPCDYLVQGEKPVG